MKKIFRTIYVALKGLGYARLAASYVRSGNPAKAKKIMQEYDKCK